MKGGRTPLSLVSPKGQFTMRGKTAQTGRAADAPRDLQTLPELYDRSNSNNRNGQRKINNLMGQAKEGTSQYGNLFKGQTIDLLQKDQDAFKNKNFADIRVNKLHKKKIPDQYQKQTKTVPDQDDAESIPSDIEPDQWAEINKYDFELFQRENQKKKEDYLQKRNMVRNTLANQIK